MSDQDPTTPEPVLQDGTGRKPGTFVPGDKRINRRGRPKSFAQLRERVLAFLAEQGDEASGTRLEAMLRQLAVDDPKTLLEYGFGKVPTRIEGAGLADNTLIIVQHAHETESPTNHSTAPAPGAD